MSVHLLNPSDVSFGVALITPRWLYVPFPGTLDFARWEQQAEPAEVSGIPLTRYWLIPPALFIGRPMPHLLP